MLKEILLVVVLFYGAKSYATSVSEIPPLKLTPGIERMISGRLDEGLRKEDATQMLEDVLRDIQDTEGPVALNPLTGQPYFIGKSPAKKSEVRPDELKGCVTRTKTTCTGTGKDRVCETDSWEVCVGSD